MKRKLVSCLIFASTIGTSYVYANMGDVKKSALDNATTINDIDLSQISPFFLSNIGTSDIELDFENKGENWIDTDDVIDPYTRDPQNFIDNTNNLNNNAYYIRSVLEGPDPDTAVGGVVKNVQDLSLTLNGSDGKTGIVKTVKDLNATIVKKSDKSYVDGKLNTKTDSTEVNNIITSQIAAGGTIAGAIAQASQDGGVVSDAIKKATQDGGSIAIDIQNQVEQQSGAVYNAIASGSSTAVASGVLPSGDIYDSLSTVNGSLSKAFVDNISASNSNVASSVDTRANSVIDTALANGGKIQSAIATSEATSKEYTNTAEQKSKDYADSEITKAINGTIATNISTGANTAIINALAASGGQIYNEIAKAAEEGGAVSEDIQNQVTNQEGPVYDAITSGSSISITNAIAASGSGAIYTSLNAPDGDLYKSIVSNITTGGNTMATSIDTRANSVIDTALKNDGKIQSAIAASEATSKEYTNTAEQKSKDYADSEITKAINGTIATNISTGANTAITNALAASGGQIYNEIAKAAEEGGAVSEDIQNQVTNQEGPVYDAITSGSSISITNAIAASGSGTIYTSLNAPGGDLYESIVSNITTGGNTMASSIDARANNLISTSLNSGGTFDLTKKADNTRVNDLVDNINDELDTKLAKDDASATIQDVMGSGSGLQIITNEANSVISQALSSGSSVQVPSGASFLLGDANSEPGAIYKALSDNNGELAQAVKENILPATGQGLIGEAVDEKITIATNDIAKGIIGKALAGKADKTLFDNLQSKVNNGTSGLDTKLASVDFPNRIDATLTSGGSVYAAVTDQAGEIAQEIERQVQSQTGIIGAAVASGASLVIDQSIENGRLKDELAKATAQAAPIGTIIMWPSNTIPEGWLLLNGQSIADDKYQELRTVLGGLTSLPNFAGRFPRGVGGNSAGLLAPQNYATARPTTSAFTTNTQGGFSVPTTTDENGDGTGRLVSSNRTKGASSMTTSPNTTYTVTNGGDVETRPVNIAVNFIIKAE